MSLESNKIFCALIHMISVAPSGSVCPYTGSELPGIKKLEFEKYDFNLPSLKT